jgi:transcriptional regulator NrdR family protein
LDEIAYIRFASVYQDFANVQDFARALQSMTGEKDGDGQDVEPSENDSL